MKRLLVLLFCLALTFQPLPACAEETPKAPFDAPTEAPAEDFDLPEGTPDGGPAASSDASEAILANIDGETVRMSFDNSPEYSSIESGAVQASFYSFINGTDLLYELYLTLPETAAPGMTITPEYVAPDGVECSVVLIISDNANEQYYYSSQMDGGVYPPASNFAITIDAIADNESGKTYSGRLSASLVCMDLFYDQPQKTLSIAESPFSFTISAAAPSPRETPAPDLSSDMRRV